MPFEQIVIFTILAGALVLFAWGRIRYDLVAVLALLAAVFAGIVPAERAFEGFGHPAVITVAAILILSRAISNSHLIEATSRLLKPLGKWPSLHVLVIAGLTAACSAFMNNVGALALILPIALESARAEGRSPSQLLMPISFASLLGGLVTLIGTPPNIIISSFRAAETGADYRMFDFTPVGFGIAVVGVAYISLVGWRLLPLRAPVERPGRSRFHIEDYITEVRLPEGSPYVGRRLVDIETIGQGDVAVVALVRRKDRMLAPSGYLRLAAGDILILEADTAALKRVVQAAGLAMVRAAELTAEKLRSERVAVVEVVVAPDARLIGRTARSLRLHTRYGLNLLGVARQGRPIAERLGQVRFLAGDVLLLQGERESLTEALASLGCLPLAERDIPLAQARPSILVPAIFALGIAAVVFGLLPPQIAFVAAAVALVLFGAVTLRELYDSIDWSIIVLLGAMIPVGMALETTGASAVISAPILALEGTLPVPLLLALLMIGTMMLTDIMNNVATAVLMAPIGIAIAHGLEVSVDPFLMAVAIGSSSTFLTPIGHQSNLLVMGPGGYRFGDYWRMGLPLDLLILATAVPLILWVWPL